MDTNELDDKVNNYDAQASPSVHIKTVEPELDNIALKPISTGIAPEQKEKGRRKLLIYIKESDVISEDQLLLDELKRTLLSSRGVDEVSLEIETSGIIVAMDWPPVKVNADLALETELKKILKDAGDVSVQSLMF